MRLRAARDSWPYAALMQSETMLTWLLRIAGTVILLALPSSLLPTEWMATTHMRLGMGEMPRAPLVEYLTRSASLLYAMHGGILLAASLDVRRYAGMIFAIGWLTVAFGLGMFGVDLYAGMPWYWTALEGLPTAAAGVLIVLLARRVADASGAASGG